LDLTSKQITSPGAERKEFPKPIDQDSTSFVFIFLFIFKKMFYLFIFRESKGRGSGGQRGTGGLCAEHGALRCTPSQYPEILT